MITAPNRGVKTLDGTNCFLLGEDRRVIIDVGPDMRPFQEGVARLAGHVEAILLTHDHPDHAAGAQYLASLLNTPLWASEKSSVGSDQSSHSLHSGQSFPIDDQTLTCIASPGHSWDHMCFYLQPDGILFSGDVILGTGTTLIALPEGDVATYLDTLRDLRSLDASLIAPGHGPLITKPREKIDEYLEHRRVREQQLLSVLTKPKTVSEMVEEVYVAEDPDVQMLAWLSVQAQLAKLLRENLIQDVGDGRYQLSADS